MTAAATALVKPSKVIKGSTSAVRTHSDAVDRAREIYLAQIKRAEADYFERIKNAAEIITGEEAAATEEAAPPAADAAAASA